MSFKQKNFFSRPWHKKTYNPKSNICDEKEGKEINEFSNILQVCDNDSREQETSFIILHYLMTNMISKICFVFFQFCEGWWTEMSMFKSRIRMVDRRSCGLQVLVMMLDQVFSNQSTYSVSYRIYEVGFLINKLWSSCFGLI